jgi:hypothetical protein
VHDTDDAGGAFVATALQVEPIDDLLVGGGADELNSTRVRDIGK